MKTPAKIKKPQIVFIITLLASLMLGYMFTMENAYNVETAWQQITSRNNPAFTVSIPGLSRHIISEVSIQKQTLKSASFITENNEREYVINIIAFPEEFKKISGKEIFKAVLDELLLTKDSSLISYYPTEQSTDFKIESISGGKTNMGRMNFKNGYLLLQMVSYKKGNFSAAEYNKFIESLTF